MTFLKSCLWSLKKLLFPMKASTELDDEMEFHIEMSTQQKVASGIDPKTARKQARREFGQKTSIEESCRMNWGMRLLEDTMRDLKFAVRQILKHRSYSVPVLIILTLCIAFNLTIFDRIESWILKPIDIPEAQSLYELRHKMHIRGKEVEISALSLSDYGQLIQQKEIFDSIAFFDREVPFLYHEEKTLRRNKILATMGIWDVFRTQPAIGRAFTQDDVDSGNLNICVISHRLARELFDQPASALGQSIRLNVDHFQIIGVLPESFELWSYDIWAPFQPEGDLATNWENHRVRGRCVFRKKDNISATYFETALSRIWDQFRQTYQARAEHLDKYNYRWVHKRYIDRVSYRKWDTKHILFIMQILCLSMFLIGCANIVSLLVVQLDRRHQEILIRTSLGAKRSLLLRQFLTELFLIFAVSGLIAICLKRLLDLTFRKFGLFYSASEWLSPSSIAFVIMIGLIGFIICAAALLYRTRSNAIERGLRNRGPTATRKSRGHSIALFIQFSLASTVTLSALFLSINMIRMMDDDYGFQIKNRWVTQLIFPDWKFEEKREEKKRITDEIKNQLKALPSVQRVNLASSLPLVSMHAGGFSHKFELKDEEVEVNLRYLPTDPEFLPNMGITLLKGRNLEEWDANTHELEILVMKTFAETYFPDSDPIGHSLEFEISREETRMARIVGVISDVYCRVRNQSIIDSNEEFILHHVHDNHRDQDYYEYVLEETANREISEASVRKTIREVDRDLYVYRYLPYEEMIRGSFIRMSMTKNMASIICVMTILLSVFGVFSFLNYQINMRRKELAIRISLGGNAKRIARQFYQKVVLQSALGFLIGALIIGFLAYRFSGHLSEIHYLEPTPYLITFGALFVFFSLTAIIPISQIWRLNIYQQIKDE